MSVASLQLFFAWDAESAEDANATKKRTFPADERARRRKKTKAQRIARRRNRR